MQVSDVMTPSVHFVHPEQNLGEVAAVLAQLDVGALPVADKNRLVGMITDRDIVVRGVAEGMGPWSKVKEVMSPDVKYCYEDEKIDHVAQNMADIQVRRLPVMNRDKRLVGIISLADIAARRESAATTAIKGVSERRESAEAA
jgi:CBS domain-containing protein